MKVCCLHRFQSKTNLWYPKFFLTLTSCSILTKWISLPSKQLMVWKNSFRICIVIYVMLKGQFTVFTFSTLLFHERNKILFLKIFFSIVVQSLSHVQLFTTPWTVECQASLSFTISWSLLKLMSIESVMSFSHRILCCPLRLLPSVFPSIRVFSNELALRIRWPKHWSFSFSNSPSNEYSGLFPLGLTGLISFTVQETLMSLLQHHNSKLIS